MAKYIFVTGGVLSSLGKGLTAAGIGALLEGMGKRITFLKLDPYLNIDPGTMSPYQHGEVFVTEDGTETDLDLGHYERFTHASLTHLNSVTAGKLYAQLIEKERRGDFLGATVQVVPHFTNEIKEVILKAAAAFDCILVEIGGTVGDIEGLPFIEAIRQMGLENKDDCLYVHLTYIPYLEVAGELKTKPTQHSVKELLSLGIQPDILICRSSHEITDDIKKKIALFTNVNVNSIISVPDLLTIYEMPVHLHKEKLDYALMQHLGFAYNPPVMTSWNGIVETLHDIKNMPIVRLAIVGKYIQLKDAYRSLVEALIHAQIATKICLDILWVDAESLLESGQQLENVDGILVPGGFGDRGVEGKILAARYAREHKIPYFGICLGMQIAIIEFARHVLHLSQAHSTEFKEDTEHPVIDQMATQKQLLSKGGTMRLGSYECLIKEGTKAFEIYQKGYISERHRHRYEFNHDYVPACEEAGLVVSGFHGRLPEMIELQNHPFFVACQFHPELQSKPFKGHPLFVGFINAMRMFHETK